MRLLHRHRDIAVEFVAVVCSGERKMFGKDVTTLPRVESIKHII
jgi:hypothetical protein